MAARTGPLTLLVANGGGHLAELVLLGEHLRLDPERCVWATPHSSQAQRLLDGRTCLWVRDVRPKDVRAAIAVFPRALSVLRRLPIQRVISTGAAMAVPFAAAAQLMRVPFHYVESLARTRSPSLSGRLIAAMRHAHTYSQYEEWRSSRWRYAGSVLGTFLVEAVPPPPDPLNIVVTFGTQPGFHFDRAATAVERVVGGLGVRPKITWQLGPTARHFPHLGAHELLDVDVLAGLMQQAHVVIAHGGVGSALMALAQGRAPILLPRERLHKEHTDDHQSVFAGELTANGLAQSVQPERLSTEHIRLASQLRVIRAPQSTEMPLRAWLDIQ